MNTRIALITILLVCLNGGTARAVFSWTANTCQISIPENKAKGSLYTIDAPENAHTDYTYAIPTQNVSDRFAIDANGVLSSKTDLDFESNEKAYSVQFTATHSTEASKSADTTCEIQVIDVNDVRPEFAQKSYNVDVLNNVAIGTNVLTVSATDGDVSEEFKKVVYSIKGNDAANFTIDATNGNITAANNLTGPHTFILTVVATDSNNSIFTDEASVTMCINGCTPSGSSALEKSTFAFLAALVCGAVLM